MVIIVNSFGGYVGNRVVFVNGIVRGTVPPTVVTVKAFGARAEQLQELLGIPGDYRGRFATPPKDGKSLDGALVVPSKRIEIDPTHFRESISLNGRGQRIFTWLEPREEDSAQDQPDQNGDLIPF